MIQRSQTLEARAEGLLGLFVDAGFAPVSPPILQPADVYLDTIGEELRGRTYVFTDPDGDELCLRPDLTVPACRHYLAGNPDAIAPARLCYTGLAFRFQPDGDDPALPREFHQVGLESLNAADGTAAEAEVLTLTVEAVRRAGLRDFRLRLGDLGLFDSFLNALGLPERWRQRLRQSFTHPEAFRALLHELAHGASPIAAAVPDALLRQIDPDDAEANLEFVSAHLERVGIAMIGTRSAEEIAERLAEAVRDLRAPPLAAATIARIEAFAAVAGPPEQAIEKIAALARDAGLDVAMPLDAFRHRLGLLERGGVGPARAHFAADFGRNPAYYSGLVFQIDLPGRLGRSGRIAGGGRYDGLVRAIGAPREVPAVGSAIHTERLFAAADGGGR